MADIGNADEVMARFAEAFDRQMCLEAAEAAEAAAKAREAALRVGHRIGEIRRLLDLTQDDFARRLGTARSYLSEVERGQSKASIEMLIGIATGFPVFNLRWLLTGAGAALKL